MSDPIETELEAPASGEPASPAPSSGWPALEAALRELARLATAAHKAVEAVDAATDPVGATAALATLERLGPALHAEALHADALKALTTHLADAAMDWRLTRLAAFAEAAAAAGLPFARVTTDELRMGELTVRLDLDRGEATLSYAREPLQTLRAEPRAVVEAVRKQTAALGWTQPADAVFREFIAAYRVLCAQTGLPLGERVNLVDLVSPLFYVRQPESFWKKQDARALRPVTRAQLAWDLDHLQAARHLEGDGLRILLGTATGGSTAKKQSVLFLESAAAGGQYFLTFAVRRVEPGPGPGPGPGPTPERAS